MDTPEATATPAPTLATQDAPPVKTKKDGRPKRSKTRNTELVNRALFRLAEIESAQLIGLEGCDAVNKTLELPGCTLAACSGIQVFATYIQWLVTHASEPAIEQMEALPRRERDHALEDLTAEEDEKQEAIMMLWKVTRGVPMKFREDFIGMP